MASRILRRLRDLLDVDASQIADGRVPVYRSASGKHEYEEVSGGSGSSTLAGLDDVTGTAGTGKAPVSDGAGSFPLTDIATQAELNAEAATRAAGDTAAISTAETYSDAALATHVAASDPHTGYQKESEKGNANGYASLDGGGTVPDAQIPAAIARDAEVTSAISTAINNLISSAPGTLDTLDELAAALGDDPNFAASVTSSLAGKQPLDSDLTAIAALSTTAFGRGLLELANQAALLAAAGAAAASHQHAGEDITSGTVADARIAASIARDSEVTSAIAALSSVYQPLDSDLTAIAALTTTSYGRSLLATADASALRTLAGVVIGTDVPAYGAYKLTAAPSADTTVNGITEDLTAGETLVFGDPVYMKSDGKVWKADANGSGTFPAIGVAAGSAAANATVTVLLIGVARNDAWAWTVGGLVYLSTSAGLTQTQPSATDDVIQVIGVAPHADRLYVNPQLVYLTHT